MLFDTFDLEPVAASTGLLWVGWRCFHTGGRRGYREVGPVVVSDLTTLPVGARVYLSGQRWRRAA